MNKLLTLCAMVVIPLCYGLVASGIARWSAQRADRWQDAPEEVRNAVQEFEAGKETCSALAASAGNYSQTVALTQTSFIRHGKQDAPGNAVPAAQKAWLREFDRRADAEQCVETFVRALRDIRRAEAVADFCRALTSDDRITDAEKSNLSRYLKGRLAAEKNREEATKAFSTATGSSGFADCVKLCDKFSSEAYDYPFTSLRTEIETLRQKAKAEFAWHSFLESQEDDAGKLARINDFITSYPTSPHVRAHSPSEAERHRKTLQANVDWSKAVQEQLEPKPKILQFHRFVEEHPEDPRGRLAADKASNLLEGLFRVKVLSEMEATPTIRLVSRRTLLVTIGTPVEQDAEKVVVMSDGKRSTFLRSSLAGEPEYTEDYKRRAAFNAELAKTAHTLKKWDARVLDDFAQMCRTSQFEEQAVYLASLAEIVRVCPRFKAIAVGGGQTE